MPAEGVCTIRSDGDSLVLQIGNTKCGFRSSITDFLTAFLSSSLVGCSASMKAQLIKALVILIITALLTSSLLNLQMNKSAAQWFNVIREVEAPRDHRDPLRAERDIKKLCILFCF